MDDALPNRYLSLPASGSGPGVLVLHAWWGLTGFIRELCDRLASEGFAACAPDLFAGQTARTPEEAERLVSAADGELVARTVLAAADDLGLHPAVTGAGVAVIGFSFGAYWALWLTEQRPALVKAVTLFYGTNGGEGDFSASRAAFQGHFAETDPYEDAATVGALEQTLARSNRPVDFHTYPDTGHWFFESDQPGAYHIQAAEVAWRRTTAFLREQLGGG